ncbi:hypothetical protein CJF31_00006734 [Rutstroemia sp. NJR-2017a BVV2]|nr:hypothetical protein CJF31_00006734 [Rutstroemia sp. NJR-2017a BVV2]
MSSAVTMKPFRLSKFMTAQSGLEHQVPKKATPNNGTCAADVGRRTRAKHSKVKTGCLTCRYENCFDSLAY